MSSRHTIRNASKGPLMEIPLTVELMRLTEGCSVENVSDYAAAGLMMIHWQPLDPPLACIPWFAGRWTAYRSSITNWCSHRAQMIPSDPGTINYLNPRPIPIADLISSWQFLVG